MSRAALISSIISAVSANHPKVALTQTAANTIVDSVTSAITQSLKTTGTFSLQGFGTFRTAARAARTGVNPQTGAKLSIPATQTVTFKPSAALKDQAATFALPAKRTTEAPAKTVTKTTTKKAKK